MAPVTFLTHSCAHCQALVIEHRQGDDKCLPRSGEPKAGRDFSSNKLQTEIRFDDLVAGEKKGCLLFRWILDNECVHRPDIGIDDDIDTATYDMLYAIHDRRPEFKRHSLREACEKYDGNADRLVLVIDTHPKFDLGLGRTPDLRKIEYFGLWDPETMFIPYRTVRRLHLFADEGDPSAQHIPTRPIENSPLARLSDVKQWLDGQGEQGTGVGQEPASRKSESHSGHVKPKRILRILPGVLGNPRLSVKFTDRLHPMPPFAVLSYCWGADQPVKIATCNQSKFMSDIPFPTLPATIRDAVVVCQRLEIEYLWIDALCILQDDDIDKSIEIAKMPHIYATAAFTIVASCAVDARDGFLHDRISSTSDIPAFVLPWRSTRGETGSVTLIDLEVSSEPIDSRGWTFQERLMSRRLIEFRSYNTVAIHHEIEQPDAPISKWMDGWLVPAGAEEPLKDWAPVHYAPDKAWGFMMSMYTMRELKFDVDRPLAISGIADKISSITGDEYVAGLWKGGWLTGVIWHVDPSEIQPRPQSYTGPSWSWLAVSGPTIPDELGMSYEFATMDHKCVELLSISAEPVLAEAPYGATREGSGKLVLSGHLAQARCHKVLSSRIDSRGNATNEYWIETSILSTQGPERVSLYLDSEDDVAYLETNTLDMELVALPIRAVWWEENEAWFLQGLLLRRVRVESTYDGLSGEEVVYKRIGMWVESLDTNDMAQDDENDDETRRADKIKDMCLRIPREEEPRKVIII